MQKVECNYDFIPSNFTGHSHDFVHIFIPMSKMVYIRIDNDDHWLNSDSIAYINSNIFHRVICSEKILWFSASDETINKDAIKNLIANPIFTIPEYLKPLIGLIHYEALNDPHGVGTFNLFQYLCSKLEDEQKFPSIQFMKLNYTSPITIKMLAKLENYNPNYYISWFKGRMGKTPNEYLTELRIARAKELLSGTNFKIIDVALQTGYTNASSFSRTFRSKTGTSPQTFRSDCKKSEYFRNLPYWNYDD